MGANTFIFPVPLLTESESNKGGKIWFSGGERELEGSLWGTAPWTATLGELFPLPTQHIHPCYLPNFLENHFKKVICYNLKILSCDYHLFSLLPPPTTHSNPAGYSSLHFGHRPISPQSHLVLIPSIISYQGPIFLDILNMAPPMEEHCCPNKAHPCSPSIIGSLGGHQLSPSLPPA